LVGERPTLLADGGVENYNSAVDELIETGILRRLLTKTGSTVGEPRVSEVEGASSKTRSEPFGSLRHLSHP
jgi:hypothetical protein